MLPYIKVYPDFINVVRELDNGARGRLLLAIMQYANGEEPDELTGAERIAFIVIKSQIDRDADAYEANAKKQSENGKKGGRPKKPTAFSENPKNPPLFLETHQKPKKPEKEKEEEKDKEKDKEEEKDKDKSARTRDADAFAAFAAGDGDLLAVLKDFEKMRRSIKKPMTDRAKQLLVTKLKNEFPPEQWKSVLEQSIVKCWQDVYPLKEREQQRLGVEQHRENVSSDELENLKAIYAKVKGEQP
jgi:hypothetical protein